MNVHVIESQPKNIHLYNRTMWVSIMKWRSSFQESVLVFMRKVLPSLGESHFSLVTTTAFNIYVRCTVFRPLF